MSNKIAAAMDATLTLSDVSRDPEFSSRDRVITSETTRGLGIEAFGNFAAEPKKLLCFLPSAQRKDAPPQAPFYPRWSWASGFPEWDVLSLSDPMLNSSPDLAASWFASSEEDIVSELAAFIKEFCERRGINIADVVLYGSSMGGYGALMIAAELKVARAVAEVPQLDLLQYPDKDSLADVEKMALQGRSLASLTEEHPERTNVYERLLSTRSVPPMTIITNRGDSAFQETLEFVDRVQSLADQSDSVGSVSLHLTSRNEGHSVQPTPFMLQFLKSTAEIPAPTTTYFPPVEGEARRLAFPLWHVEDGDSWGERDLNESVTWVKWTGENELRIAFDVENSAAASTKGMVFSVAAKGSTHESLTQQGFHFSTYRGVGYFKYVELPAGSSTQNISVRLESGASIEAIGLAAWDVKSPLVRDLRLS
ncbi:prolyl oligopeptidase family serine peptidase [Arthrobacter sp. fls2-241-R2A-172]|uniref:prolyl oligopeptidase family serine peptidase n=1 Tax=Arthrobacter sp. fls2-241-R2A-172 TaxID=3040325 RepID=UPI00254C5D03|nr:prolyl oligopeptidase family serine peptidase [Arthrobacter sp. fls2-241-R2A-172]